MILSTLLTAAALFGGPTAVLVQGNTSAATAEGVDILRGLLVDSLDETFSRAREREKEARETKDEDKDVLRREPVTRLGTRFGEGNWPMIQSLWSYGQTVEHSRAFHMPGVGVFVTLDAALPVLTKEAAPTKDDGKGKDDEWERKRREVRGGASWRGTTVFVQPRGVRTTESEIDPQAIERAIESVLKTVARFGTRVEGMATQETITVALRVTGRHSEFTFDEGNSPDGEEGEDPDRAGTYHTLSVLMATDDSIQKNLVVRVAVGDLVNYTEAGYERLRQRAQVNVY